MPLKTARTSSRRRSASVMADLLVCWVVVGRRGSAGSGGVRASGPEQGLDLGPRGQDEKAEPVVGTTRLLVEQEVGQVVVPAFRSQATLGRTAERTGGEGGKALGRLGVGLQEGAHDGPEGAVERVGQIGR